MPRPATPGSRCLRGRYAKKHVPSSTFALLDRAAARVVPRRASRDCRQPLPELRASSFRTHATRCTTARRVGDRWLRRTVDRCCSLPRTVIFITFDEGTSATSVPAFAAGTAVRPATRVTARSGHYSLLRTIEDAWSLPRLGASMRARPITGSWR
jgi:acid phosphatase